MVLTSAFVIFLYKLNKFIAQNVSILLLFSQVCPLFLFFLFFGLGELGGGGWGGPTMISSPTLILPNRGCVASIFIVIIPPINAGFGSFCIFS